MKNLIAIVLFFLTPLLTFSLEAQKFSLEPVRAVGCDEDDKYSMLRIFQIKLNNDNSFIVGDYARLKLTMYDSNGKFVKRVGRPGQGPNEYKTFNSIASNNKHIYVLDSPQRRINIYDKKLNYIDQIKRLKEYMFTNIFNLQNDGSMLTSRMASENWKDKIFVKYSKDVKEQYSFFNKFWRGAECNDKYKWAKRLGLNIVQGSYRNKKVIFGLKVSDNPTDTFVYTDKGEEVIHLSYKFKHSKYKFDRRQLTQQGFMDSMRERMKQTVYRVRYNNAFIYKDYYIVFITYYNLHASLKETDYNMFLVYDKTGKLLHEEDLCNNMRFYDMNDKGYIIGCDSDEEPIQAIIYKFTITKKQ